MKEVTMVLSPVLCPHYHSDAVIKGGKTKAGIQRYKCLNATSSIKAAALRSKNRSSTWRSMGAAFEIQHGC